MGYHFDYGNRLRWVDGRESYRYDAYGRRILAWSQQAGGSVLSTYSYDGKLIHPYGERKGGQVRYPHTDDQGTVVQTCAAQFRSSCVVINDSGLLGPGQSRSRFAAMPPVPGAPAGS